MRLYDGKRIIRIACFDDGPDVRPEQRQRNLAYSILHPELENLPVFTGGGKTRRERVYVVRDVQPYIDAINAWQAEEGRAGSRCAGAIDEDVAGFEAMNASNEAMNHLYAQYGSARLLTLKEAKNAIAEARAAESSRATGEGKSFS